MMFTADPSYLMTMTSGCSGTRPPATKRTSKLRAQICDTRALWRAIKAKTATNDDFIKHFPNWIVDFWSEEEQKIVLDYQIDMAVKAWK